MIGVLLQQARLLKAMTLTRQTDDSPVYDFPVTRQALTECEESITMHLVSVSYVAQQRSTILRQR